MKESSVRGWKKQYEIELKSMSKSGTYSSALVVPTLPAKKQGRPPLLGVKINEILQERIALMRERGAPIGTSIVIGIGRGIVEKYDKSPLEEFGGPIKLTKEWAKSVFRRMGFTKRRANSTSKVLPLEFDALKEQFLIDINSIVVMEDIPEQLVINWDQTAMKIVPSSAWTMEKKGTKRVEISAADDKRQITAVFACALSGCFLPMQLMYQGTTERCLPSNVPFPANWHITYTANYWSNENTMVQYIQKIILPYVSEVRGKLDLADDYPALVLFDVFKGQCTESVFKLLKENNIFYVMIPANCTDKIQPLDLSVNKPAKDFMKRKFQNWYGSKTCSQLEDNITEPVDLRLSKMKPLIASWIIDLYNYLLSRPDIIINGFHSAGITQHNLLSV